MSIWKVYAKKADFYEIGKKYNIDPVVARVIRNRDVIGETDIEMYLSNGQDCYKILHNPRTLLDMDKAVSIIKEKISSNSKIRIIGDYDIDGICSIYILYKALEKIGADVDYVIPHRIVDGYGINENLILQAKEDGIDTIITCDNGIAAIDQIAYGKKLGMTMIITDHHDIPYIEDNNEKIYLSSKADAIINPKQIECTYPFKVLCGAGVAFKLVQVLYEEYEIPDLELSELIEFAAIATIGDIVDLKDENRVIVKLGLNKIKNTKNLGLKALIDLCGIDMENISTYHIGFIIGPCLNASGRLDTANRALQMLLEKDEKKAYELAGDLKALNDERKDMTQKELLKGLDIVEKDSLNNDNVLVVYLPDCHESLAGIIAGRIREKYYKPTIVLTNAEEGVKGSGRSIDGYNMFEEINKCKDLLIKFGGHPMAAGMSLSEENVENFRKKLNDCANLSESDLTKVTWIDVAMPVDYVTMDLVKQLSVLEPFGKSNEKPIFADNNLIVKNAYLIGKNKNVLKITLENERGNIIEAISFRASQENLPVRGDKKSILYYPNINLYNGRTSLQFNIIEMSE
ncbi:single-stranded-DNA-specific exonuclease RecJ [[Clostridium] fimetarium]|uniref:Single-stranded-DNA-specific exonuclease RecJ n=1 Tax=[Clostridium] fimetarium TaxID=99656 RepID=A0A1I0QB58_9FIRM|nr:single-stranded-DNA-specific exonuclease RecJ [[Clostridium] fimetarium]SEW24230.1 single-stranded-DNA-specific exonuclease [[Clostridium] fimetarium]